MVILQVDQPLICNGLPQWKLKQSGECLNFVLMYDQNKILGTEKHYKFINIKDEIVCFNWLGGRSLQKCVKLKDEGNRFKKKPLKSQQNQPGTKTAKSTMREIMKPSRQKKNRK